MIDWLRISTDGKVSWDEFRSLLETLMPNTVEGQITLFLKSYVPKEIGKDEIESYRFTKADIIKISRDCLEPMFEVTDDDFFTQLYENYALTLFQILGMREDADDTISLRKLKKLIYQAEGFDHNMLALLYGVTGIMNFDETTQYNELGTRIRLNDAIMTSELFKKDEE